MKFLLIFLFSIFFFLSCSNKGRIPSSVIQPEQMKGILLDILIADAVNNVRQSSDTSFQLSGHNIAAIKRVLINYKVTKEKFQKSYDYYLSHPDLLKPIADSITAVANRRSLGGVDDSVISIKKLNGRYLKDTSKRFRH